MRPRVFVSSVMEGFQEYREAARHAIEKAGGEPILVNEDFPAVEVSSRNACLDAVDSCDIYIAIIGERGGWTAPSGKLVVEEEYCQARTRKLPVLLFLQDVDRDVEGQRLAEELSDYVNGLFRATFRTPTELEEEIERALKPILSAAGRSIMDKDKLMQALEDPYTILNETTLRFILTSERSEEVIDPVQLESKEFIDRIYEICHSLEIQLFSYQRPKKHGIEGDSLVIHQQDQHGRNDTVEEVRLELTESGQIILDSNVTGRVLRGERHGLMNSMVVMHEDIETVLDADFLFAAALFDEIDRFKRHQRFVYNVLLTGLGYRNLVEVLKEESSYSMNVFRDDKPIVVFNEPRLVGRSDLQTPESEINRVLTLLSRKVGTN